MSMDFISSISANSSAAAGEAMVQNMESAVLSAAKEGSGDDAKLRKAARDFEALLLHRLMQEMSNTVDHDSLLSGPMTQQVQGIFWLHLAQDMADKGGMGLWKEIYNSMKDSQGQSHTDGAMELLR
ncbi:MAG: hypothetical protein GXY38_08945 [Planctomycetes bacterium]|jgi:Rod binding domain-containing protein|nr:hypothetical protein [Planctomycetota bacterium]